MKFHCMLSNRHQHFIYKICHRCITIGHWLGAVKQHEYNLFSFFIVDECVNRNGFSIVN